MQNYTIDSCNNIYGVSKAYATISARYTTRIVTIKIFYYSVPHTTKIDEKTKIKSYSFRNNKIKCNKKFKDTYVISVHHY
jgi:hypothetical protein